jgi:hypothetical protein
MLNPLNLLVVGGFDKDDPNANLVKTDKIRAFAPHLARAIISEGHILINGCRTELDRILAEAAAEQLPNKDEVQGRVVSYVLENTEPAHTVGTILDSARANWDIGGEDLSPPEVIQRADAVILLGGFEGTFQAANWARYSGTPLLPFRVFGGSARRVYDVEIRNFEARYGARIQKTEFEEVLQSRSEDWATLADQTVNLAERIATNPRVLLIMSFSESTEYDDLVDAIKEVCEPFHYEAQRIDESNMINRIVPAIIRELRQCAFVIADVTETKVNVYYELGFAHGLGKDVILVAKQGTQLPFDIADVPVIFWDGMREFKVELTKRVKAIGEYQGRDAMGSDHLA